MTEQQPDEPHQQPADFQLTRNDLASMTADEIREARTSGRLNNLIRRIR